MAVGPHSFGYSSFQNPFDSHCILNICQPQAEKPCRELSGCQNFSIWNVDVLFVSGSILKLTGKQCLLGNGCICFGELVKACSVLLTVWLPCFWTLRSLSSLQLLWRDTMSKAVCRGKSLSGFTASGWGAWWQTGARAITSCWVGFLVWRGLGFLFVVLGQGLCDG